MKIISVLIGSLLILNACASNKYVSAKNGSEQRTPSSSVDEENLDQAFKAIMESPDPASEMKAHLNRLKQIYYRAEFAVQKFDSRLDDKTSTDVDMMSTPEYRDSLAVWALKERMLTKVSFIYEKLYEMRYGPEATEQSKEQAKNILTSFHSELRSPIEADKVIYHDLIIHLADVAREFRADNRNVDRPISAGFRNANDLVNSVIRTRPSFIKQAEEDMRQGDVLSADLEMIKADMPDYSDAGREPQSASIFPSAGPQGNVNGSKFPVGTWALTYDDGPSKKYTPSITKNLNNNGMKATFFWLAQNVKTFPTIVTQVKASGMLLANHSYSHANLPKQGQSSLNREINQSTAVETEFYGYKPKFFRCPYGACNPHIRQMIADQGMIHVFWNVDSLDWQDKNPASVLNRTQKQMAKNKRGVVLFHDIHSQSMEASRMLMEKTRGSVRWVTMQQIVDEINGNR